MLISIIIPVYNAEKFLAKCLDSVINQTYKKLEIILVNDGSTDHSGIICEEYAKRDNRFIFIHKENGGVSSARNTGLKAATGQYIGFIDPDDWIEPIMFERLYQLIIDHHADISMCGYMMENINGKIINQTTKGDLITFNKTEALNTILDTRSFQGFSCNKLFSADVIKSAPALFFDTDIHYGEDLLFCCEFIAKSNNFIYDPSPFYHYIIHENNITQSKYSSKKLTLLTALEKIIHSLSDEKGIEIDKFKSLYIYTNITLLMYGIQEKKCTGLIRKHLKENLHRYKLSYYYSESIKISCFMARINVHLYYLIWKFYKTLMVILHKSSQLTHS